MKLTPEQIAARLAERNPFATRSVRPGAVAFRFYDVDSAADLIQRLQQHQWRGEIVGPHGSGKSTLLHSLATPLRELGRDVKLFTVHKGESRLPIAGSDLQTWNESTQVMIDGYEQLGSWTRTLLTRICRKQGCGMLITTHDPAGTPVIYRTSPTLELTQRLVRDLQSQATARITDADVAVSYERQAGNIREVFFELYDLYERRRPPEPEAAIPEGPPPPETVTLPADASPAAQMVEPRV